jgi:poly-gamma-glutamate synthesis protein (capsule biosynthesis protein)
MSWFRFRLIFNALIICLFLMVFFFSPETRERNQAKNAEKINNRQVSFLAVGDIMLSRGVAKSIARSGDALTPFKKMAEVFGSTDFNFGNLESPISGDNDILGKDLTFNTHTRDVAGLKVFNFKVLNLANNHALDQGLNGLLQTRKFLSKENIKFLGTGKNLEQAWEPKIIVVKGIKIGFVGASYSSINDGGGERNDYVTRIEDTERLKKSIKHLKTKKADFIVAAMHAGDEYTRQPNQLQINFARAAIDSGADIVLGSHPHWVQTIEKYQGKYIFYSLGNFIFDQTWSRDTMEGLTLKITLQSRKNAAPKVRLEQIELLPVIIENAYAPRPANETETRQILEKIGVTERILK